MLPHILLLHTLPNACHYLPLWTQALIVADTAQSLRSEPYHPLRRGCSVDDESSPTTLFTVFPVMQIFTYKRMRNSTWPIDHPPCIYLYMGFEHWVWADCKTERQLEHPYISGCWAFNTQWSGSSDQIRVSGVGKESASMERIRFTTAEAQGGGRKAGRENVLLPPL